MKVILAFVAMTFFTDSFAEDYYHNEISEKLFLTQTGKKEFIRLNYINGTRKHLTETGQFNGVAYRFYHSDGSAAFAGAAENSVAFDDFTYKNWHVKCEKHPVTRFTDCTAFREEFRMYYSDQTGVKISFMGDALEHTPFIIRVDNGKVFSIDKDASFSKAQSEEIIALIKNGTQVATSYTDWPFDQVIDKIEPYYGTQEVVTYMKWAVANIQ